MGSKKCYFEVLSRIFLYCDKLSHKYYVNNLKQSKESFIVAFLDKKNGYLRKLMKSDKNTMKKCLCDNKPHAKKINLKLQDRIF